MRVSRLAAVLGTLAVALPAGVAGQSVTYHSSTEFHMAGALGALISRAARSGAGGGVTTYIAGHRMRTDSRDHSTIIDVDAGRIISIDKDRKAYSSMTFEQFAEVMRQAQDSMKAAMARQPAQQKYAASSSKPHDDIEWDYQVSTATTDEHQRIAGYDAQRQFITMTVTARDKTQPDSGSLVVLMDIWTSQDAPNGAAVREFQRAYAAKARETFEPEARNFGSMMAINPRFKAALEEAGKELHKVHGTQLRTTTYLVGVPENVKFDRNLVLSGAPSPQQSAQSADAGSKPSGLKGLFGKMKAAAEQAEQSQQNQKASKPAEQGTILWFTNEVDDIKPSVPADAFSIPAGYTLLPSAGSLPRN